MNHTSPVVAKQSPSGGCSASRPSRVSTMRDKMNFARLNQLKLQALDTLGYPRKALGEKR